MATISIYGLPGTGKSTLALSLAAEFAARGDDIRLLHTDLLKVTARSTSRDVPKGAFWQSSVDDLGRVYAPLLDEHVKKARRAGYDLLIEGTLAVFAEDVDMAICLKVDEDIRRERAEKKPEAQRAAVRETFVAPVRDRLMDYFSRNAACYYVEVSGGFQKNVDTLMSIISTHRKEEG